MFFDLDPFRPAQIPLAINSHKPEKLLKLDNGDFFKGGPMFRTRLEYQLARVTLIRGETDSPESDYELIIAQNNWRQGDPPPPNLAGKDAPLDAVREIFQDADDLGFVKVADVDYVDNQPPKGPKLFRVVLKGTPRTHRIWATQLYFASYKWPGPPEPLGALVFNLAQQVIKFGSWIAILAGVIITSFFIPNMLRKGSVDLLLAKPIHRWALLFYKYLGGLTFVFIITAYSIGGIWLVIGIRSGLWANASLLLIFSLTFFFAILYAISTLVGVLTRNAFVSIVVTVVAWAAFAAIGMFHSGMEGFAKMEKLMPIPEEERWGDGKLATTSRVLHAITPHTEDLNKLNDMLVFTSFMTGDLSDVPKFDTSGVTWWTSLLVSSIWIAIFVGLAAIRFTYKDY
jgi:ABC-type transport system involved in multi-copper enzyme maturation permease subunit